MLLHNGGCPQSTCLKHVSLHSSRGKPTRTVLPRLAAGQHQTAAQVRFREACPCCCREVQLGSPR